VRIGIGRGPFRRRLPGGCRAGVQLRCGTRRGADLGLALRQVTRGSRRLRIQVGLSASRGLGAREIERLLFAAEGARRSSATYESSCRCSPISRASPPFARPAGPASSRRSHAASSLWPFPPWPEVQLLVERLLREAIGAGQPCQFHRVPRLGEVQRCPGSSGFNFNLAASWFIR
jgi:hypothetical protein